MDRQIERVQSLGRTSLGIALAVATWVGVTAMAAGLLSWLHHLFA